jgi:diguanylate cyclase (GGDEF)-like protein/PAS domain S-box-containing protein
MRRWRAAIFVMCAAAVAAAAWFVPTTLHGATGLVLVVMAALAVALTQRSAAHHAAASLESAHREQMESERRYEALFEACNDAIFVYEMTDDGQAGCFVEVNEAACMSLGYSRSEIIAMSPLDINAPEAMTAFRERVARLARTSSVVFETVHVARDGHRLPVEVSARLVEIGGRSLCFAVARNIAARKELEELLRSMSHQDELTGLFNRRGFFMMVEQEKRRAMRMGAQALLLYADLDGLKAANDRLGHAAGDALLLAASDALRATFRSSDVLARLGGDEFVALAILGRDDDDRLDKVSIMVRLQEAVAAKQAELGEGLDFSLSYGTLVVDWGELAQIDELLARADAQMYEVKRRRPLRASVR